jgi:hypothetical protein
MPQNRWINITLDPNAAGKSDRGHVNNGKGLGAAAAGDLTISYDTAKFTSLSVFRAAIDSAIEQAAQSMRP